MDWTVNDFKNFVDKQRWITAKTYAESSPHQYALLKYVNGTKEDFISAAAFIRENGFPLLYWRATYMVFHLEGHFYWTMDEKVEDTDLINRNDLRDYDVRIYVKRKN